MLQMQIWAQRIVIGSKPHLFSFLHTKLVPIVPSSSTLTKHGFLAQWSQFLKLKRFYRNNTLVSVHDKDIYQCSRLPFYYSQAVDYDQTLIFLKDSRASARENHQLQGREEHLPRVWRQFTRVNIFRFLSFTKVK